MNNLPVHAHLYTRLAVLRRRVLFRHYARHLALGAAGVILLVAGLALVNVALFLKLRQSYGDITALLVVAAVHVAAGAAALALTLKEPSSAEIDALAEAEAQAFDALRDDTRAVVDNLRSTNDRINQIATIVSTGIGVLSALNAIAARFDRRKVHTTPPPEASTPPDALTPG